MEFTWDIGKWHRIKTIQSDIILSVSKIAAEYVRNMFFKEMEFLDFGYNKRVNLEMEAF